MNLYIYHHLGLGDHFDCNGLVRYYAAQPKYEKVGVFAKSNYFKMVEYMYRDNERIEVISIDGANEWQSVKDFLSTTEDHDQFLKVGYENYHGLPQDLKDSKNCWELFYELVGLPLGLRYSGFYVEREIDAENTLFNKLTEGEPYIFMHDDPSRGYVMDRSHFKDLDLRVVENDPEENIFHFLKIIEEAQEIHCMESSFKTLIDVYASQEDLFFHDFRNHPLGKNSLSQWKTVSYKS
tara:strand:+ start:476 stop:1186 length:711 start_codon:yes stop_codon:yes gene_type:complete